MDNQEYVILSEIRDLLRANLEVQGQLREVLMAKQDEKKPGDGSPSGGVRVGTSTAEAVRVVETAPNVNWSAANRLFKLSEPVKAHIQASGQVRR